MKKNIFKLVIINMIILLGIVGCSKKESQTTFEKIVHKPPKDALALIINDPKEEQLSKLEISAELNIDKYGEDVLLIPKNENTTIQVWSIKHENGELVQDKMIYVEKNIEDNFVLKIKINRPEGIPSYKIIISNGNNSNEYLFHYNGKSGTPNIEYV